MGCEVSSEIEDRRREERREGSISSKDSTPRGALATRKGPSTSAGPNPFGTRTRARQEQPPRTAQPEPSPPLAPIAPPAGPPEDDFLEFQTGSAAQEAAEITMMKLGGVGADGTDPVIDPTKALTQNNHAEVSSFATVSNDAARMNAERRLRRAQQRDHRHHQLTVETD